MRKTMLIAALGTALAAGGVAAQTAPAPAQPAPAQPAPAQTAPAQTAPAQPAASLSFSDIAGRLERQGFTIDEMERERAGVEVEATGRDGRRVKLLVDAATGEILRREDRR